MKYPSICLTAFLALCGSSLAADLTKKPAQPATTIFSWTGGYVGGQLGASILNADATIFNGLLYEKYNLPKTGFMGGVQAGYLFQFSNHFVLGAELSYSWTDITVSKTVSVAANEMRARSITVQDLFGASLRAGYALNNWLPYLKAGYANSGNEFNAFDITRGQPSFLPSSARSNGWIVGAGIDHAFTANIVLGVEYNFSYFDVDRRATTGARYATARYPSGEVNMNYSLQTLMARLSYKF